MSKITSSDAKLRAQAELLCSLACDYRKKRPDRDKLIFYCHPTARMLAFYMKNLKLVDGWFLGLKFKKRPDGKTVYSVKGCQHSWLVTPDGTILDPCPIGFKQGGALLVVSRGKHVCYGSNLYLPDSAVTKKIEGKELSRQTKLFIELTRQAVELKQKELLAKTK
jgi:hypothetical protein